MTGMLCLIGGKEKINLELGEDLQMEESWVSHLQVYM